MNGVKQACSQACVAEVAKLPWRDHVVQYLRTYLILYAIQVKWIMCVQEKNEVFSMSQRPRLSSIKISGDLSFSCKEKAAK